MRSSKRMSHGEQDEAMHAPASSVRQIDPKDFHSVEAQRYTERCVQELMASKSYQAFRRHETYHERLFLTWFLAPLSLLAVFYCHLIVFSEDYISPFTTCPTSTVPANSSALINTATLALLFFVIPWTLLAPFSGFFEELSGADSFFVLAFFTAVNVVLTSFGGRRAHFSPFITADPPVPWFDDSAPFALCAAQSVLRALPLQGFLVACYWLTNSRRTFWRRAWHLPLPLLTTPVLVGLCGIVTWRVVHLTVPFFVTADFQGVTPLVRASGLRELRADPVHVLNMWKPPLVEIGQTLRDDVVMLFQEGKIPGVIVGDGSGRLCLYLAALALAGVYFAVLFVRPIIQMVFDGLLFFLPTDPTVWGLSLAASCGTLATLIAMDGVSPLWPISAVALIFSLLYNGFVA